MVRALTGDGRDQPYPPIADYALVGDSRACALISRAGSVDWMCLPDFDSPAVFARLLDRARGGFWRIAPQGPSEVRRRYIDDTNVLETTFSTPDGEVALIDFMPALLEEEKRGELQPLRALLRIVEGRRGRVRMRCDFEARLDYARVHPQLRHRGTPHDVTATAGAEALHLRSDAPLVIEGGRAHAEFDITADSHVRFSLVYSRGEPAVIVSDGYVDWAYERSLAFWRDWSAQCTYAGPYRREVLRSALTLKLLSFAPSGAIAAAATASLPEDVGGERNYDYRYCWLRDASFAVRAMIGLGLLEEARAFNAWLMHATHLTAPRLNPLYTLLGEPSVPERELNHFEGYRGSRPVRIGNKASQQHQFDVYGELLYATCSYAARVGHRLSRDEASFLQGVANYVAAHWREPDNGIWEQRLAPQHYTHSKAMAWLALVSAAELVDRGELRGDARAWRDEAARIRACVLEAGYNARVGAFTQTLGGDALDAAVLTFPLVGLVPGHDPRMRSTIDVLRKALSRDGFLRRYDARDGMAGGEGVFVICNFWLAAALATCGESAEARAVFEATLAARNDVGLMAEEFEPESGQLLGNFPQAFSHIGLIVAARALEHPGGGLMP